MDPFEARTYSMRQKQTMPTDRAENQESEVELEIDLNSMDVLQVLVLSLLPPVLLPLQFKSGWLQGLLKHAVYKHYVRDFSSTALALSWENNLADNDYGLL